MQPEWTFNLPRKDGPAANKKYRVELIDTWNMTIKLLPEIFETGEPVEYRIYDKNRKTIRLPMKPYLALRIVEQK